MINVKSEIMPLKRVLLHRPGNELLNLTPDSLQRLLFDDIPYLKIAREEHDEFARILTMNGVEVVYLEDLMTEVLDLNPELKEKFIRQFVYEAGIKTPKYKNTVINFLMGFSDNKELVLKTMEGININELHAMERDMEHSHVTFTIKQQYTPWHIPINNSIEIEPLNCSFFANTIFGEEFWMTEPDKYPTRYYGFSTKLRFNLGIGQSINFDIIPEKRRRSRMVSLYYELSVCELNIVNMFNRYIGLDDVVCLGVGIRYYR